MKAMLRTSWVEDARGRYHDVREFVLEVEPDPREMQEKGGVSKVPGQFREM